MTCDAILILGFLAGVFAGVVTVVLLDNIDKKKPARFDPPE